MNKSTIFGVVGSSTIHQNTQEESHPPVHLVIGGQVLVGVMELAKPANLPQPLSTVVGGNMEYEDLGRYPQTRDFVEAHLS